MEPPDTTVTTLTTLLNVRRGSEAIDFYTRAFGAVVISRMDAPDGTVVAHLSIGNGDFADCQAIVLR